MTKAFFTFLAAALLASVTPGADALWPQPRNLQTGSGSLKLGNRFDITLANSLKHAPSDLRDAVSRTKKFLKNDKLERLIVGRGQADKVTAQSAKELSSLTLSLENGASVKSITEEAQKPIEARDEAYTLTVPGDGSAASITANSTLGLLRGLTTFTQLWYEADGTTYALDVPISIQDSPAYVCPITFLIFHSPVFYFLTCGIR